MKFDFAIGNPPYQDNAIGENDTYAPPVYNKFLDAAYAVADSVEMIHPARFLFNAGSTPKAWNEKMLNDPHFKVMHYEEDASKVFANTDIKGGVAITYRTSDAKYEPIVVFTKYPALNHILHKVNNTIDFVPMDTLVVTRTAYRLTEKLHQEHTEAMDQLSKGHPYDMSTNIFDRLPQFFFNEAPNDGNKYIRILGRENSQRVYKYIRSDYVNQPKNLFQYKIFLPSANGNGVFGETLTAPVLGIPGIGSTETFISVGCFDSSAVGNLIALPLQGKALQDGNSAFIDGNWNAYPNQWETLFNKPRLSQEFLEEKIKEWSNIIDDIAANAAESDREKPWNRMQHFNKNDVEGKLHIILSNGIYVDNTNLKAAMQNRIRRMAAISNPVFYKNQAIGTSNYDTARWIYLGKDHLSGYIQIPRGLQDELWENIKQADIDYEMEDERQQGRKINVDFKGELRPEQDKALQIMNLLG